MRSYSAKMFSVVKICLRVGTRRLMAHTQVVNRCYDVF